MATLAIFFSVLDHNVMVQFGNEAPSTAEKHDLGGFLKNKENRSLLADVSFLEMSMTGRQEITEHDKTDKALDEWTESLVK